MFLIDYLFQSAVDLLTAMIRYAKSPLPNEFTEQMFPIVMELGWNSTDEDILQVMSIVCLLSSWEKMLIWLIRVFKSA